MLYVSNILWKHDSLCLSELFPFIESLRLHGIQTPGGGFHSHTRVPDNTSFMILSFSWLTDEPFQSPKKKPPAKKDEGDELKVRDMGPHVTNEGPIRPNIDLSPASLPGLCVRYSQRAGLY